MKKYVVIALLIGILIGFGICYGYFSLINLREKSKSWCHVQVGTFYYVWYAPAEPTSWEYPKICDKPVLGYYNSCDPEVIAQHFAWLSDLHIDFIVVSWWGFYDQTDWNSFVDNATYQVFSVAKENVTNVKVCIMVEAFNWTENPTYSYTEIHNYIYDNFVEPYPTVYYKYTDKPLICFFNNPDLTPNGTFQKDSRFETIIVGGDAYADWIYTDLVKCWVSEPYTRNRQVSVTPRFDDSRFRTPPHINDTRLTNDIYGVEWKRAIELAKQNAIDVVTICSWNEYPERTSIEPHYDSTAWNHDPYFLYNETLKFTKQLKGIDLQFDGPQTFGLIFALACVCVLIAVYIFKR